jgi:hypothetical protein
MASFYLKGGAKYKNYYVRSRRSLIKVCTQPHIKRMQNMLHAYISVYGVGTLN